MKKSKTINLPMRFNLLTEKYEPDIPSANPKKINWYVLIYLLLGIISLILIIYFAFK
jgi:hypothetical protein